MKKCCPQPDLMWGWSVVIPYTVLPKILASGSTAASFPSGKSCNTSCSLSFGIMDDVLVQDTSTWPKLDPFPLLSSTFIEPLFISSLNYANLGLDTPEHWTRARTSNPQYVPVEMRHKQWVLFLSSAPGVWGWMSPCLLLPFSTDLSSPCPLQEGYPCYYCGRRCIWEESIWHQPQLLMNPRTISHGQWWHALSSFISQSCGLIPQALR